MQALCWSRTVLVIIIIVIIIRQCHKMSNTVTTQLLHVLLRKAKSLAHTEKSDKLSDPLSLIRVLAVRSLAVIKIV